MAWKICQWEIIRNLKNKQFIIGLLITPLVVLFFAGIPNLLLNLNESPEQVYLVKDQIEFMSFMESEDYLDSKGSSISLSYYEGNFIPGIVSPGKDSSHSHNGPEIKEIQAELEEENASGLLILDENSVNSGTFTLYSHEQPSPIERLELQSFLQEKLQEYRMDQLELDDESLDYLMTGTQLIPASLEGNIYESIEFYENETFVSIAFAMILFVLIMMTCSMLLQSALQEKQNKMSEIILSSVKPIHFMQGKILGNFILGLFQLTVWIAVALPVLFYVADIPALEIIFAVNVLPLIFFGLLGYLFFAAIFVSIGATIGDLNNVTNFQGLAMALPAISIVMLVPVLSDPGGPAATAATMIPLTSPIISILRIGIYDIPRWELALGGSILVVSTFIVMLAASKLFRVGMLMYGKNASLSEIVKWLKY